MSPDLDLTELPSPPAAGNCAQCGGPLPAPIERLAIVHGREGEMLSTCSTSCLAGLVVGLAGRACKAAG